MVNPRKANEVYKILGGPSSFELEFLFTMIFNRYGKGVCIPLPFLLQEASSALVPKTPDIIVVDNLTPTLGLNKRWMIQAFIRELGGQYRTDLFLDGNYQPDQGLERGQFVVRHFHDKR